VSTKKSKKLRKFVKTIRYMYQSMHRNLRSVLKGELKRWQYYSCVLPLKDSRRDSISNLTLTLRAFQRRCPVVYVTFHFADIRHFQVSKSSKNRTNAKVFGPQLFFRRDDPNFSTARCYRDLPSTV